MVALPQSVSSRSDHRFATGQASAKIKIGAFRYPLSALPEHQQCLHLVKVPPTNWMTRNNAFSPLLSRRGNSPTLPRGRTLRSCPPS